MFLPNCADSTLPYVSGIQSVVSETLQSHLSLVSDLGPAVALVGAGSWVDGGRGTFVVFASLALLLQ